MKATIDAAAAESRRLHVLTTENERASHTGRGSIIALRPKRDLDVDAIKGLAILLVVLGHAIQRDVPDFDQDIVFRTIYSFHMPLFMFLSGLVAYGRPINLFGKLKILVIPFLSWYFAWYFVDGVYRSITLGNWVDQLYYKPPDDRLWFLWILFLNFCVLSVALKMASSIKSRLSFISQDLVILLAIVATKLIPAEIVELDIPLLRWYFLFFAAGYLIARHRRSLARCKRPVLIFAVLAFAWLVSSWYRIDDPSFTPTLHQMLDPYAPWVADVVVLIYLLVVPLLGIALSFALVPILKALRVYGVLCWLGLLTMDIYVSHQVFMFALGLDFGTGLLRIASAAALGLSFSLALAFLLKKVGILNTLFLGGRAAGTRRPNRPARLRSVNCA